jgi:hypothetical protein
VVLAHYAEFGTYSGVAEQLAIAAGGMIVYATSAKIDAVLAARLTRLGQLAFGFCALLFGGAHFFYMNLTAPLVPKWLPPTQELWAYATGIGFITAGVAILTGVQARLAAILSWATLAPRCADRREWSACSERESRVLAPDRACPVETHCESPKNCNAEEGASRSPAVLPSMRG